MIFIDFEGTLIRKHAVAGVTKVAKHMNGVRTCDWEYGFEILVNGNKILYTKSLPKTGQCDGPTRADEKVAVENRRKAFITLLTQGGENESIS